MWDASSRFTAQTSTWSGSSSVSGSGFLSKIRARQNVPAPRRWQSMYNLAPETSTRWSSSSGSEYRAGGGERSFYPTEAERWLQDAHDRLGSQLDRLRTRDMNLSYNTTMMKMFDTKQEQLSETISRIGRDAAEISQFDMSREQRDLHQKVRKLENDLLQMRSALDKGSDDQLAGFLAPTSLSRPAPNNQEVFEKPKKENVESEVNKLREALKEAEARAKTHEDERDKAVSDLRTAEETQRMMSTKLKEMETRFGHTVKSQSEEQEELREANNKISQACLDKAGLSTQVLKLENDVKDLKTKLREAPCANYPLIQEREDHLHRAQNLEKQPDKTTPNSPDPESQNNQNQNPEWIREDMEALQEKNEKLRTEAELIQKSLDTCQRQLQELNGERITNSGLISGLEAERSQLIREKEELLTRIKLCAQETQEKSCQHRKSVEVLELDLQKVQDQCLVLEARVTEKERMLHLQEEEFNTQDDMRVKCIEELKAEASHWTEKWQNVALSLQATQNQLDDLKRRTSADRRESGSELRAELQNNKPELEQEPSRAQSHQNTGVQWLQPVHKETLTDLSESSLVCERPSDPQFDQSTQAWTQNRQVQCLRPKLAEKEKEVAEREHAFRSLEKMREMQKAEAQIRISAPQLQLMNKVSEDDGGLQSEASDPASLQLDECGRNTDLLAAERHLKQQPYLDKDEKLSADGRKDNLICAVNPEMEQQRRMITEQLKSMFRQREGKEDGQSADTPAQTGTTSPQDWTPSLFVRAGWERRNWQQNSGLMPVFEEDEEDEEDSGWFREEEEDAKESHAEL